MFVKISKADVLQSIGFALTAAEEEYNRVVAGVGESLRSVLEEGQVVPADVQADMSRALTERRDQVERIKTLKHMAEFAREDEGVLLDTESFKLLEANLPAR
jgi:hypothetical protein